MLRPTATARSRLRRPRLGGGPTLRIQLITQYYLPQPLANAEVIGGLAQALGQRGHQVDVVTPVKRASTAPGVDPRRTVGWFAADRASVGKRLLEYASFSIGALVAGLVAPRPDVVVVPSPPPSLGLVGAVVARLRRVPFVYNVQDLYPEIADAVATPPGSLLRLLRRLVARVYRSAAAVVVIDEAFIPLIERAAPDTEVVAIPNAIDLEPFEGAEPDADFLRGIGVPPGVKVVMYAGNVGRSQDLRAVVGACAAADAHLVIHGGGATLDAVRAWAAAEGSGHVHFSTFVPRTSLGRVFASADLHVVPLKPGVAWSSVPSKLLSICAAGRPVVLAAESGTPAARILDEAGAGWRVDPGDPDALAAAIAEALAARAELESHGSAARRWALDHVSSDRMAATWEALLERITGKER